MTAAAKSLGETVAYDIYKALWSTEQRWNRDIGGLVHRALERCGWTVFVQQDGSLSCYRGVTRCLVEIGNRTPPIEQVLRLAREVCDARIVVLRSPVAQVPLELQGDVWTLGLAVKP